MRAKHESKAWVRSMNSNHESKALLITHSMDAKSMDTNRTPLYTGTLIQTAIATTIFNSVGTPFHIHYTS